MTSSSPPRIQENVPLAPLTTLGVGGTARFFIRAETEADVQFAHSYCREHALEMFVLGGGSNLLVSDEGFDGLVLAIALKGIKAEPENAPDNTAKSVLTAAAGEDWDGFVRFCVGSGLAGVECLSGIPGQVGGTPVQNVGAYGQEVSGSVVSVRCFDRETSATVELSNAECGFAYRSSIFNSTQRERYVILAVKFALSPGGAPFIGYRDLQEFFNGRAPSLAEVREAVLRVRAAKSMVIDPDDPNSRSAGSFFKNPVVERKFLTVIADAAGVGSVPNFDAGDGLVKVPAAWLIERAGFAKGYVLGNAGISSKHSLALINRGGASAAEIVTLKQLILDRVASKFRIQLVPEPIFVGRKPNG